MIAVWVPGAPKTKGSMTWQGGGRGRAVQSVQGSEEWAWAVTKAASDARGRHSGLGFTPVHGPVFVRATFWLPVPDVTVARAGDLDKLLRNVLDALTKAGAYGDDVQVTRVETVKYATDGPTDPAGVLLEFEPDGHREGGALHSFDVMRRWGALRQQGLA